MNSLSRPVLLATLFCLTLKPCATMAQTALDRTVDSATTVLDEIMTVPAKQIPQALLSGARGVAIIPNVVKGGFVVGVRHGRGVVLVRDDAGNWHPPVFASLTGGSIGWQAGLQSTDVVLVFRSRRSVNGLMSGKLTIGADAAAAAGPVGRQVAAATDASLKAEILSYSRSRGLFAGVSIDGSALQVDHLAGRTYYGTPILGPSGEVNHPLASVPRSGIRLMNRVARYSGSPQIVASAELAGSNSTLVPKTSEAPQSAVARRRLISSWQILSALLDDPWKEYLELPRELLAGQPADTTNLRKKLQQYAIVVSDKRYAKLAQRPEFATTHQLLRDYVTLQATESPAKLTLPPPPSRRY